MLALDAAQVWVVIPYYQRAPGVLARALRSVFAQEPAWPAGVLVVDDASPASASDELDDLPPGAAARVTIIRQENRGPGGARNRALADLPSSARYVAFLDSDDEWTHDHLALSMRALGAGATVSIANWWPLVGDGDGFVAGRGFDPATFPRMGDEPGIFEISDAIVSLQLRHAVGKLSTVVFDRETHARTRFDERLRHACEDRKFFIDLAFDGARTAAIPACTTRAGSGVNIYFSLGWRSQGALRIALDQLRFCADMRRYPLTTGQRALVGRMRDNARKDFFATWAHRARAGAIEWRALARLGRTDAPALAHGPLLAALGHRPMRPHR